MGAEVKGEENVLKNVLTEMAPMVTALHIYFVRSLA